MNTANAVAEEPEIEPFTPKKRKRKMSLKLDENGIADISGMSEDDKSALLAAVMMDEDTKGAFSQTQPAGQQVSGLVSADDIRRLFGLVEIGECFVLPRLIKSRTTIRNLDGTVRQPGVTISPTVASQAFTFQPQTLDKVCPLWAQAANEHLPEKIRRWICATGPLGEAIGITLYAVNQQIKLAILLQRAEETRMQQQPKEPQPATSPTNGQGSVAA
jgi:hypothetical protein